MVALGMQGPTGLLDWLRPTEHMWSDAAHPDVSNVPALTARVAELERERDAYKSGYENHRAQNQEAIEKMIERGERVSKLETDLAAARKVEDGEVTEALLVLDAEYKGSHFGRAAFAESLMNLLTRLSAALKEAERRETEAKTLQHELASDVTVAVARAQAAEAKLAVFETHVKGMLAEAFDDGRLRSDLVLEGEPGNGTEYAKDRISQLKEPRHD